MRLSSHLLFSSIALVASLITVFATSSAWAQPHPDLTGPVATVGPNSIASVELQRRLLLKIKSNSYHGSPSEEKIAGFKKEALDELIKEELFFLEAKRLKMTVTQKEIDSLADEQAKQYGGKKAFEKVLAKSGTSIEALKPEFTRYLLVKKLLKKKVEDKSKVSKKAAKKFFKKNRDRYVMPESFHIRHIVVKVHPSDTAPDKWNVAEKTARKILKEFKGGADFGALKSKYKGVDFADLGFVHQGSIMEEFAQQVGKMEKGDIAGPVKSLYGYHVFQMLGKKEAVQLTFEKVADAVVKELSTEKKEKLMNKLLKSCRDRWKVKILPAADSK